MWRWLAAEPRDVGALAGAGTLADGGGAPALGAELRRWRGVVARRRLVALVRRHGAVALGLAALLEILAQLGALPQWAVVAVPLAALLVSVPTVALRGPSPFGLARLLDDKLGLNDRLATALEIEARGGGGTPLERRTVADAAALLRSGREDWHASPARAGRGDWSALAGGVAALAAVVAIGALTAGSSSAGPTAALGPRAGGGAGNAPNERHPRQGREEGGKPVLPASVRHRFKNDRKASHSGPDQSANEGYQQIPQGARSGREGKAGAGKAAGKSGPENTPTGKPDKGKTNPAGKGQNEGTRGAGKPRSETPKEKDHPTVGFNVKGGKHGNGRHRGNSKASGAPGPGKSAPSARGDESTASPSEQKGGAPSGSRQAGGERGTNQQGHATPITGQASQAVKIQPGYAPSRSTKGGAEHRRAGDSQGAGGKARTGRVTGGTQVGDEFTYVPAAGGAVPSPSAGLQLNYLESLRWVERLPW